MGCFICTYWSLFYSMVLDEATDPTTDYINCCKNNIILKKEAINFPNIKPRSVKINLKPFQLVLRNVCD